MIRQICGALLALGLLAGCASGSGGSEADKPSAASATKEKPATKPEPKKKPGKFEQTWKKDYGDTTCDEWLNDMNQHENFVAAGDMLLAGQRSDDDNAKLPSDSLIKKFKGGISTACVEPALKVTEIAAALYTSEKPTFKP